MRWLRRRRMTIGSLFSGIGGIEIGLERAGLGPVIWQAERDAFCLEVLAKHWPDAHRYEDVKEVDSSAQRPYIICGGFPCQDISVASRGRGGGIQGKHSGLWQELVRAVEDLRPSWVVVENVDGSAWRKWVPLVRGALHIVGYASVPIRLPASYCGAPFRGSRVFVVAKTNSNGQSDGALYAQMAELPELTRPVRSEWGRPPPGALGMANGLPNRSLRLTAIGNAVVPHQAEAIGRAIVASNARWTAIVPNRACGS